MPNSYTSLHYHVVFSTKGRYPWVTQSFEERIWSYLGGIARKKQMSTLIIGGVEDHIHMLLCIPPTISMSKAMQLIKGNSSKWIHQTFPPLKAFDWQDGYCAFSVSKSQIPVVETYIRCQREHHSNMSFKMELQELLERHEVEYDERYLWD